MNLDFNARDIIIKSKSLKDIVDDFIIKTKTIVGETKSSELEDNITEILNSVYSTGWSDAELEIQWRHLNESDDWDRDNWDADWD